MVFHIATTIRAFADDRLPRLTWGGDQEGGGPYIFPQPDDPNRVTGFEVDLMDEIAKLLGKQAHFRQCQWDNLPDLLRIGEIDCICNGYEFRESHLANKIATIPYYIYELQLVGRKEDAKLTSWDDLKKTDRRRKIGVLQGSAAEDYVRKQLGDAVEVFAYPGVTEALQEVVNRKLDATVQDLPPLVFYKDRYPTLRHVGAPVGRGYYVMYLQPGGEPLRDDINGALFTLINSGKIRKLYERYGIWNETQEKLGAENPAAQFVSTQVSGWEVVERNLPILLEAAWQTVKLACTAMPLAVILGIAVALGRIYGPGFLRIPLAIYVEVLRGTPVLLQLFALFYLLPSFGIRLHPFVAAVLGLGINYSAYEAEVFRLGLLAIPPGQMEAGLALGMTRREVLRRVIFPQAFRMVIPAVTNDFIALFKDTSVASMLTIVELTKRYAIVANSTGAYLELAIVTAILYLLMSYPLSLLARKLENRQAPAVG
jgi:polar amino acid transport system substrate-binding protein